MSSLPILASMILLAQEPIAFQYEGPLKGALKEIALKGHINVVVAGDLDETVQVNLTDLSAEEALETMAKVYGLSITRQGKLWIVRERPESERPAGAAAPAAEPSVPKAPAAASPPALPALPPLPALPARSAPPVPATPAEPASPSESEEAPEEAPSAVEVARSTVEQLEEQAAAAREQAEVLKDQAQELAEARREQADALREVAEANAELARNRVSTGGPVRVEANTTVDSAIAYGGPVIIGPNAVVQGDAVAFGGDVVLEANAQVEGDAVAFGGTVVKGPNAEVRGETVSMGGSGLSGAITKAAVKGHKAQAQEHRDDEERSGFGRSVAMFLLQFGLLFGLGFALMMFAPQRMSRLDAAIRTEPTKNGLAGLLGLIAAVPATVLLVVTLVGIPVAMLLWIVLALLVPVGLTVVANAIGTKLPTGPLRRTQATVLAVGVLMLLAVSRVPVLGELALALAVVVSFGAIIRTRFGQAPRSASFLDSAPSAATV